jgi:Cu+-exporting ATPase
MPRRTKAAAVAGDLEAAAWAAEEEEKVAVFEVSGMTCAACAGSVEKAVKRLHGIHDAAVDVLGCRAQVAFYPAFVSVSSRAPWFSRRPFFAPANPDSDALCL